MCSVSESAATQIPDSTPHARLRDAEANLAS
jgi:hypothetical protein